MDDLTYIRENVPEGERLAQLAEEAAELAQAALKLRRALERKNPTPISTEEARNDLVEEIADVRLCLSALEMPNRYEEMKITHTIQEKTWRWVRRLRSDMG